MSSPRLSARTLATARVGRRPAYDRSRAPGIVHLGVGAFARAHLGVYADDLLGCGWPAGIHGLSLRRAEPAGWLTAQDGLYTVVEQEPGRPAEARVIGSFTTFGTGPEAAVAAIAAPEVALVTLTVTEKGYDPGGPGTSPSEPTTAAGVLAVALGRRRDAGSPPLVVASLDNLVGNGTVLKARVMTAAGALDPSLAEWIDEAVAFPTSVVDRMVPAVTAEDLDVVGHMIGLTDRAAVLTEHHRSWVAQKVVGLPPLGDVGVELVDDTAPYEARKLSLLNGPHSALAYCGLVAGCDTIAAAVAHPASGAFVHRLVEQMVSSAPVPATLEPAGYAAAVLRRFANPALRHRCVQVGADGSRKLAQRLLPVVSLRHRAGADNSGLALVVAAWVASVGGLPLRGQPIPSVEDPESVSVRRAVAASGGEAGHVCRAALGGSWPDRFVDQVADALAHLVQAGENALWEMT